MPFFSSEQTDPDRKAAHRALEQLSDLAQSLLCDLLMHAAELTPPRAQNLTRLCRAACRRLRDFREGQHPRAG